MFMFSRFDLINVTLNYVSFDNNEDLAMIDISVTIDCTIASVKQPNTSC